MYNTITEESFKFIERLNDEFYTIELLKDNYEGTKYQYGNVRMEVKKDTDGEEYGQLSFDWKLIDGEPSLENDINFQNYIGDILNFIILDAFDSGKYRIGDKDESTVDSDNNTQKSTNQREIHT